MKTQHHKILESVLRRILRESQEEREERGRRRLAAAADKAAFIKRNAESATIVLYDPRILLRHASDIREPKNRGAVLSTADMSPALLDGAMLGVIGINRTFHPCNGAWEVNMAASKTPGDGGLIYGLAYAAAGGTLASDRYSVSPAAQRGWATMKGQRGGKPLDDVSLPPEERRTPDDPSDDCDLHRDGDRCKWGHADLDSLNRSYEAEGWEDGLLDRLESAHEETMRLLPSDTVKRVQHALFTHAAPFFRRHYKS